MVERIDLVRNDPLRWQRLDNLRDRPVLIPPAGHIAPKGVVSHRIGSGCPLALANPPGVLQVEDRLDAGRTIIAERNREGPRRSNREQMRVTKAVSANAFANRRRQTPGETTLQIALRLEPGEGALFSGQLDGGRVRRIPQPPGDRRGHGSGCLRVIFEPEHDQCIAQAAIAKFWRDKNDFVDLPTAWEDRAFLVDPTYPVPKDIRDANGVVLVRAGEAFNPLHRVPMTKTVIVFKGTDVRQVKRVADLARQIRREGRGVVLITTHVDRDKGWRSLEALETDLQGPVFILPPTLAARFQLRRVPSVIEARGERLWIREIGMGAS